MDSLVWSSNDSLVSGILALIGYRPENRVVRPMVLPTVGRRGLGGVLQNIRS
jgi:hypothetical protein